MKEMASEGPRFDPLQTHHSSSLINRRCVKMCGSVAKWIMRPTSTLFFCKTKNVPLFFFLKTLVIILNKQRLLLLLLFLNLAREDDCDDEDAHHRCSG